jgi:hypothetical protein
VRICALALAEILYSYAYVLVFGYIENMKNYGDVDSLNFAVTSAQHIDGLIHPLAAAPPRSVDHGTIVNVNNLPLTHLATIQLPKGSRTTLEFTSLSNYISFLSTTYVLCLIHFLANRLPHRLSDALATVNDAPRFKLSTLTNTSAANADTLAALSTKLTYDPASS